MSFSQYDQKSETMSVDDAKSVQSTDAIISIDKNPALWSIYAVRLRIVVLVCFALISQGMMQTDLSMAIVCMVRQDDLQTTGDENLSSSAARDCPSLRHETARAYNGELSWSNMEQTLVLGSFYWGGLVSVFAVSWLASRFGPSRVILGGTIPNIIGSFLIPTAAVRGGPYVTLAICFVMGMGQGVLIPNAAAIVASWFPVGERSTACALYMVGNQISTIIAFYLSSLLCQSNFLNGWPAIFYLFGIVGCIFCVLWHFMVCDKPEQHSRIDAAERSYIAGNRKLEATQSAVTATPWRSLLTSTVVWALILCTCAQSFVTVTLVSFLPKYFHAVLKLDIKTNGILSTLPFFVQMTTDFLFGAIADCVKRRTASRPKMLNIVTKFCNSVASFGAAICICFVGFLGCGDHMMAGFLFCATMGLLSGYIPGYFTSLLSVAPAHTATVTAVTRLGGQLFGIACPYVVGLVTEENTIGEWRIVFFVIAIILTISGLFFLIFGSATAQAWGDYAETKVELPPETADTEDVKPGGAIYTRRRSTFVL